MKLTISNVGCVTLLCLASCLGTEGVRRDLFATRAFKTENKANYYCYYDGQLYTNDANVNFDQRNSYACQDSYAYSYRSKYTVITLSNIQVNCNDGGDIELWDNYGNDWTYCNNGRPSTYTHAYDYVRWVGISRQGRVSFTASIRFTNQLGVITNPPYITYPPVTYPPITNAPITNAPVTNPPSSGSCGVQAIRPDENGLKIVGGTNAINHSWPWMAGFKSYGGFFCGGTLINDQWILTAAHCKSSVQGLTVHLGENNIDQAYEGSATSFGATQWINHPQYDDNQLINDIALVKLNRKVSFNNNISPVCLPNGRSPVIGTTGIVTGWGTTRADGNGQVSAILKQVVVPINSDNVCGYGTLPITQICAGVTNIGAEKDSCQGDSGGPFVMKDKSTNSYYIAGVVSYGEACGGRGAYTNVKEFESWIAATIGAN